MPCTPFQHDDSYPLESSSFPSPTMEKRIGAAYPVDMMRTSSTTRSPPSHAMSTSDPVRSWPEPVPGNLRGRNFAAWLVNLWCGSVDSRQDHGDDRVRCLVATTSSGFDGHGDGVGCESG